MRFTDIILENLAFDALNITVAHATNAALAAIALRGEAEAKAIMDQVDTGFARNSIAAILPNSEGHAGQSLATQSRVTGHMVQRVSSGLPGAGDLEAGVGIGADYGIFLELRKSFLVPGVLAAARQAGTLVTQAGAEQGL